MDLKSFVCSRACRKQYPSRDVNMDLSWGRISMKIFIILFFCFHLIACNTFSIPHSIPHQTGSPMTSGYKVLSFSNSMIVAHFTDVILIPPGHDTVGGFLGFEGSNPFGIKVGYGITDKIDIEAELSTTESLPDYYTSLGVKYQWLGESAFKVKSSNLTSTTQLKFIYGEVSEEEKAKTKKIPIKKDPKTTFYIDKHVTHHYLIRGDLYGFSLSNSFGYVVWDWFVIYIGGAVTYLSASYEVTARDYTGSSVKKTEAETEDDLWIYWPFAGIQLQTTGLHWKIIFALEWNVVNLPLYMGWNNKEKRQWDSAINASVNILLPL